MSIESTALGDEQFLLSYLPNPSAQAGYDTRSIFQVEFNRFEFRVFLLLD